ncbi:MAG TPA: DUF4349 domain-containing protein [Thermoanaerobaculia bacterium]
MLLVLLLLTSCKRAEESVLASKTTSAAADVAPVRRVANSGMAALAAAEQPQRMIVRSANLSLVVGDTRKAIDAITASAERNGGYVNDSKVWREGELLRATLTLRVPSAKLNATLGELRGVARRVQSESMSSQEVTEEYVDLGSRLRNLEAAEIELRALMTTVRERAKRAADVLEMHQQLTEIRSQIEQVKGRMRYLEQTSAMSAVSVDLVPDAIAAPVVEPGWQPLVVAKDALRSLVNAAQGLANIAIWLVLYVLPIAALFVAAAYFAWKLIARFRVTASSVSS